MLIPFLKSIELSVWIASVAALAALTSALCAYGMYRLARRNLAIAMQTSRLSSANTIAYLIDGFRYRIRESKNAVYVFCISIENKSTAPNSVTGAEFRLSVIRDDVERTTVFLHNPNSPHLEILKLLNILQLPAILPIRGSLVANYCFDVPDEIAANTQWLSTKLRIKYAEGSASELEPRVIMEIVDVQDLEGKRQTGIPI